MHWPAIYRHK